MARGAESHEVAWTTGWKKEQNKQLGPTLKRPSLGDPGEQQTVVNGTEQ